MKFRKKSWMVFVALLVVSSLLLSGCGATPRAEVVEVEKVVEKVVTQVVQETVIVEGTPEVVEKVVEKVVTEVVEVEVPVETVVTATPEPETDKTARHRHAQWL